MYLNVAEVNSPKNRYVRKILIGPMTKINFPFGTVVSYLNTNQRLMRAVKDQTLDLSVWELGMSERFRHNEKGIKIYLMFPVAHKMHWCMVIVKYQKIY